jgi:gamma-glutamylcyclotransferase (GGCT)/AIG2-like uncharacterized protein YtfP
MRILYFAYGSNMSAPQMARRCPGAQPAGRAVLAGWRLIITHRGSANIVPEAEAATHGVLWRFENRHIGLMDRWEGVARRVYRRAWVSLILPDDTTVTGLTYVGPARWPGRSRPGYVETAMLPGAAAAGLPEPYHDEIRSWLPERPLGAAKPYRGRRT